MVPGPIFRDEDWLAFAEVEQAVANAELRGDAAAALAEELQQELERGRDPLQVVQGTLKRVPALANARPALVSAPRRGIQLLVVQLNARTRATSADEGRLTE